MEERCAECGFDGARWRVRDAVTVLDALGWWWRNALDGLRPEDLARRPSPAVCSPVEYGLHVALVTAVLRDRIERSSGGEGPAPDLPIPPDASPDDEPLQLDLEDLLDDLEREGRDLAAVALDIASDEARAILVHAVHDATHHQLDVGRALSALGLAVEGRGRVAQINASGGGVPKAPVDAADLDAGGLAGDRQADRKHHGRPFQAVCLWPTSAIAELTAAGHRVFAGAVGENLTVEGLPWTELRAGARLRVGSALLELSYPAVPCQKQAQWFTDGDVTRLAHERNPQWARWYAWVREPGAVATGDEVRLG